MASLREIRRKIKSVKNTRQITKAMKMVASARLRKAQLAILAARPYAQKIEALAHEGTSRISDLESLPFFRHSAGKMHLLVIVTSDKGLCGAFNTNLFRESVRYIQKHGAANVRLLVIGRKGRDYFKRVSVTVLKDYIGILGNVRFAQAELMVQELLAFYKEGHYESVDLLYNEFKSMVLQRVILKTLLPILPPESARFRRS